MTDDVGYGELVTSMLQQANLASTIVNAMNATQDMTQAKAEVAVVKSMIGDLLSNLQELNKRCQIDGYHVLQQAIQDVGNWMPLTIDKTNDIALAARQGWQCTANMKSINLKMYTQQTFLQNNIGMLYDLPQSVMRERAMEWYLSAYRPANPTEQLAVEQYIRGHITAEQAAHFLAIKGVPDDMAMMLYDHYERYPSIREMCIASEWVSITDDELKDAMTYDNITLDKNKTFYLNYAHAIQLRTEFTQYLAQLKSDYLAGLLSKAEFESEIAQHKPNATEAAQIVENADHAKVRYLVNMEVQSITWLYRKGTLGTPASDGEAEGNFYESLIALEMDDAIANALVRFEACKLGYNWERE